MNYKTILEEIFRLPKSAAGKRSLESMERLSVHLGHPEKSFFSIHVAGTNGKGSVCTKIASTLQQEGYRTALYTSPHISSFCERIQINGEEIAKEAICRLYPQVQEAIAACALPPVFFEIATLLAFLYFREQSVDIAVLETGIGGLYDATNVVSPLVSVITSIGFDHQDILGPTLQEICHAKAGILKPRTPAVLGRTVPTDWILPIALEKQCPVFQAKKISTSYDEENQETARLALEAVAPHFPVIENTLEEGLKVKPPCRFEQRIVRGKEVVLDAAHNPQGFERLIEQLRHRYPNRSFRFICGFSRGKEISASAYWIESCAAAIHLVSGPHPRLASTKEIAPYFSSPKIFLEPSIVEGIRHAWAASSPSEIIVIAGSFFILDKALTHLFC